MVVEMLLLALIAVAVFAYVLAPILLPRRDVEAVDDPLPVSAEDEEPEAVAAEKQPIHDLS